MKKKLLLVDRLVIIQTLPSMGGHKTMVIAQDVKKKVQLTQEEMKKFKVVEHPNGATTWSQEAAKKEFTIEFSELERIHIETNLKKLDKEEKLTREMLELAKKFDIKFD